MICVDKKIISGNRDSTSNFLKHLKTCHKGSIEKYQEYKKNKKLNNSSAINYTKEYMNQKINDYFVQCMAPLFHIDSRSFRHMFPESGKNVVCSKTLRSNILENFMRYKRSLTSYLTSFYYVCTTADIWSSHNKSFLGVSCHLINENWNASGLFWRYEEFEARIRF